jgi:hypothetical protein
MAMTRWMWLALGLVLAGAQLGCENDDQDADGVPDSEDCDALSPLRWREVTVYADADADGFGDGAPSTRCIGENMPGAVSLQGGDCAPRDATRWRTVDGLFRDADGDGMTVGESQSVCLGAELTGYTRTQSTDDCDDADAKAWKLHSVYLDPDGDGAGEGERVLRCAGQLPPTGTYALATDCAPSDGSRWRMLDYAHRDEDGDTFTIPEAGKLCSGATLPAGYSLTASPKGQDCDDTFQERWRWLEVYRDRDMDGIGSEPMERRCSGAAPEPGYATTGTDCDPNDNLRWQLLSYAYRDQDHDTFTVREPGELCVGPRLPSGYTTVPKGDDCDDLAPNAYQLVSLYPDADGDGVGAGTSAGMCIGATPPAGHASIGTDCAPDERSRWRTLGYAYRDADLDTFTVSETGTVCSGNALPSGYTNTARGGDCNDSNPELHTTRPGYPDTDKDGVGAGAQEFVCTNGTLPLDYSTTRTDCAPEDSLRWRLLTSWHVDNDEDGHTAPASGELCAGSTLAPPLFLKASGNDCDESDRTRFTWSVLYPDKDGDGVGAPPSSVPCHGAQRPAGFSIFGFDSDDADARVTESAEDEALVEQLIRG